MIKNIKRGFGLMLDPKKRGAGEATLTILGTIALGGIISAIIAGAGYAVYQYTDWFSDTGLWLVDKVMGIMLALVQMFFDLSTLMFEAIGSSKVLQSPITRGAGADAQAVMHGWSIVRDFSNMLIVLGFIVVGIATILRIREYEAQKTLVPLIIVALLINFSMLICGVIIDATNITANYFTGKSGPSAITVSYKNLLQNPDLKDKIMQEVDGPPLTKDNFLKFVSAMASVTLFTGIAAMIFFIYGVLLLFRRVALMCLVILAPLAFVCYVFPATKPIFDKWWKQFTQWSIIVIPASFFIYLAGHMLQAYIGPSSNLDMTGANLAFWIPTAFLFFAYSLIFQTSAIGALGAIGLVTGAGRFAMGASGKVGRTAGGIAAKSRLGQAAGNVKNSLTSTGSKTLEILGLRARGATANLNAQRIAEQQKLTKNMTNPQVLAEMRKSGARGVAAFKEATERKILNQYAGGDINQIAGRAARARAWDVNTIDAERQMPELAKHNEEALASIRTANPTWTPGQVQREAVKRVHQKLGPAQIRDLNTTSMNSAFIGDISARNYAKASSEFTEDKRAHLRQDNNPGDVLFDLKDQEKTMRLAGYDALPTTDPLRRQYEQVSRKILITENL